LQIQKKKGNLSFIVNKLGKEGRNGPRLAGCRAHQLGRPRSFGGVEMMYLLLLWFPWFSARDVAKENSKNAKAE